MRLREAAEDILSIYNYFTGAVITDIEGNILYFYNSDTDVNIAPQDYVIGKNILDIYPSVTREDSSIFRVMKTGIPIIEEKQHLVNYRGEEFESVNSTFPMIDNGEIIGAVEIYCYNNSTEIQHTIKVDVPKGSFFNMYSSEDIISKSPKMEELKNRIDRVAQTDSTVLIYGETGSGKELVAQSIHTGSSRKNEKFISQNCAAIPSNLLESILFGTVKGSYTDARDKIGIFEIANGGTLFLDEIHAMDLKTQAKLLKVIEEQAFYRVGGVDRIKTNVRIIAACNKNPWECVKQGVIREDLYYRLKVVRLNVPRLRDRKEDIDSLIQYFIDFFNSKMNRKIKGVSSEVEKFFKNYTWPGNVREMRNVIECAFNFAKGEIIELEDIDCYENVIGEVFNKINKFEAISLSEYMSQYECFLIKNVLNTSKSNAEAAERMHITKQTLYNKINQFGIKKDGENL